MKTLILSLTVITAANAHAGVMQIFENTAKRSAHEAELVNMSYTLKNVKPVSIGEASSASPIKRFVTPEDLDTVIIYRSYRSHAGVIDLENANGTFKIDMNGRDIKIHELTRETNVRIRISDRNIERELLGDLKAIDRTKVWLEAKRNPDGSIDLKMRTEGKGLTGGTNGRELPKEVTDAIVKSYSNYLKPVYQNKMKPQFVRPRTSH